MRSVAMLCVNVRARGSKNLNHVIIYLYSVAVILFELLILLEKYEFSHGIKLCRYMNRVVAISIFIINVYIFQIISK